ncbi:hypothetical protein RJJ11_15685 [Rhizobium hidalgonense]|nr:hypothetical protein [Rhizobium hidalgonense]MDR9805735.1 hypothetical protein [Rhizobium hidalgonense]
MARAILVIDVQNRSPGIWQQCFRLDVDEQTGFCLLDAFVDHGFNAIDTAHRQSLANRLKLAPAVQR